MPSISPQSRVASFCRVAYKIAILLCLPLAFVASGCTKGGPSQTVSGKITFNDKPVSGKIVFHAVEGGKKFEVPTHPSEGTYSIAPAPGKYKVAVEPFGNVPTGGDKAKPKDDTKGEKGGPKMPGAVEFGVAPPAKYTSPDNGLTYEVTTAAQQEFNITLTK